MTAPTLAVQQWVTCTCPRITCRCSGEEPSTCHRLLPCVGLIGLKREGLAGSLAFLPKWPKAERPPPLRRPPRVPEPNRLLPERCLPFVSAAKRACTCCFLRCSASFFSCSRAAIALPTRRFLLAPLHMHHISCQHHPKQAEHEKSMLTLLNATVNVATAEGSPKSTERPPCMGVCSNSTCTMIACETCVCACTMH